MHVYSHGDALRRRESILRIVRDTAVHSQDELLSAMRREGFRVTQPTLSRDLRELGLVKTFSGYMAPDALSTAAASPPVREQRLDQLLRDSLVSAEAAMNLVVIRTAVAAAQPVASAIDAAALDELLGTVAGDDTIFLAFRTPAAAAAYARRARNAAGLETPARARARR